MDLICLQKTKIQNMFVEIERSLRVRKFLDWGAVDTRGAAGGVVAFWDNRMLE